MNVLGNVDWTICWNISSRINLLFLKSDIFDCLIEFLFQVNTSVYNNRQIVICSKDFNLEQIMTQDNLYFILKNKMNKQGKFNIFLSVDKETLSVDDQIIPKGEKFHMSAMDMKKLPKIFMVEFECFY